MGLVPVQEVIYWYNKYNFLAEELELNDPFVSLKYNAFKYIDTLYTKVANLVHNYNENAVAQEALAVFNQLEKDDEKVLLNGYLDMTKSSFFH
jgi:hypothetical protein